MGEFVCLGCGEEVPQDMLVQWLMGWCEDWNNGPGGVLGNYPGREWEMAEGVCQRLGVRLDDVATSKGVPLELVKGKFNFYVVR